MLPALLSLSVFGVWEGPILSHRPYASFQPPLQPPSRQETEQRPGAHSPLLCLLIPPELGACCKDLFAAPPTAVFPPCTLPAALSGLDLSTVPLYQAALAPP